MLFETLKADFSHKDERGSLVQLVHGGYKQINVIKSVRGMRRGGHYHKFNREAFYVVSGSCEVCFEKDGAVERSIFTAGDFFQIEPYVGHTFHYLEDTVLVGLYDEGVEMDNGEKDIVSLEKTE